MKQCYMRFPGGKKKAFTISYDDNITQDERLIKKMEQYHIKGTFNIIPGWFSKEDAVFPEGETYINVTEKKAKNLYNNSLVEVANHGYDHNNAVLYKSSESFINEIEKTDLAIGKAIGIDDYCSHIFRFPNGFMSPLYKSKKKKAVSLLSKLNYAYIDWNCLNNDSIKKYSPSQLLNNLKKSCKNKNTLVILMHDTKDVSDSSMVLKDSIDYIKSQGYEFKNFYEFISKQ